MVCGDPDPVVGDFLVAVRLGLAVAVQVHEHDSSMVRMLRRVIMSGLPLA